MDQCSTMFQVPAAKPPDRMSLFACSGPTECHQQIPQPDQHLNCPRCDSTNTKFCYYNNYSYSQPRYFCKNCRRYWTKGGALRKVPIGGGCRKNKRVKQMKMLDPTALASLDEATSNMLVDMSRRGNWSSLLASLSGTSWSSSFLNDLPDEGQDFGYTLRLGEQSKATPTVNSGAYDFTGACCNTDSSLPYPDRNLMNLGFPHESPIVKPEPGVLLNGSDLDTLLNVRHTQLTGQTPSLEDELSPYSMTSESFDGEAEMKQQEQQNKDQSIDHCLILPSFEEETKDYLWYMKGKSALSTSEIWKGSLQGLEGSYGGHQAAENSHFWCINNTAGLTDIQPLVTFAGEDIIL